MNGTPDWNRLFTEDAALRALPPEGLDEAAARWPWYAGWSWLRARREQLEDGEVTEATLRQAAARTGERGRLKAWLDGHLEPHLPAALHPAAPAAIAPVDPVPTAETAAAPLPEPEADAPAVSEAAPGLPVGAEPEAADPAPAEEDPARLAAEARAAREAFERAEAEREASAPEPEPALEPEPAPEPESAPEPEPEPVPAATAAPSVHPPVADPDARLSFSDWLRAMGSGGAAAVPPAPAPAGPPSPEGETREPMPLPPAATAPPPAGMPQAPRFEATEDLQALDGLIARQRRRLAERMGQAGSASPEGAEPASGERFDPGTGPLTQTWARILAEQGKTAEAAAVYRALALRHPDKSRYFAALIRELESR